MGDTTARDELVARYEWLVFGVARRNGLARNDADDGTRATFLALLESLPSIRADHGVPFPLYLDPAEPSYRDVADQVGYRIGGMGPLRARCLRRLRQQLGEDAFA